jgi:hypothetical protein
LKKAKIVFFMRRDISCIEFLAPILKTFYAQMMNIALLIIGCPQTKNPTSLTETWDSIILPSVPP